jgi:enoyl-CoA hydratase
VPVERLAVLRGLLADAEEPVQEILDTMDAPPPVDGKGGLAKGEAPLARYRDAIDFHFSHDTVEDILLSLDQGDDWARAQAATIRRMSPTSLKLSLLGLRMAEDAEIEEALVNEYRMVCAIRHGHDFFEGIRAQLIDKDRNPKWNPATLEEVSEAEVARHLVEPESGDLAFE